MNLQSMTAAPLLSPAADALGGLSRHEALTSRVLRRPKGHGYKETRYSQELLEL